MQRLPAPLGHGQPHIGTSRYAGVGKFQRGREGCQEALVEAAQVEPTGL